MEKVINNKLVKNEIRKGIVASENNLTEAIIDKPYRIKDILTEDVGMKDFLFTLGCYQGETITVISVVSGSFVVVLKDARYSIGRELAEAIII
jgi:ferrous iron transport protein A